MTNTLYSSCQWPVYLILQVVYEHTLYYELSKTTNPYSSGCLWSLHLILQELYNIMPSTPIFSDHLYFLVQAINYHHSLYSQLSMTPIPYTLGCQCPVHLTLQVASDHYTLHFMLSLTIIPYSGCLWPRAGRVPGGMIVLSREQTEQSRTIPLFKKTLRTRS